jgi:flavin reductase (DIM6/NTAB) family NADH-FMN oxidoreductase RutF
MQIDVANTSVTDLYQLLIGLVTPRPIAWVSTLSTSGIANLAPFSFYNLFGANPPVVVFSPVLRRDGSQKDTLRNVTATREFVVNGAAARLTEKINLTSQELPYGESEFELADLERSASTKVQVPRVADAPFALECRLRQIVPVGEGPLSANLVIGEVVWVYVADELLDATGRPDPRRLETVARLGGDDWCYTSDRFSLPRPRSG